jgi:acetyl-CoA C-acetyltransferase
MTAHRRQAVIVGAARTAIGKFQGALAAIPAPQLGGVAIRAAMQRSGLDAVAVDEVLMGNVISAGIGQAPARQAAIAGGLPPSVGAVGISKVCGSGLKAVMLGAGMIAAGDANIVVAGGMENMDLGPYLLPQGRTGYRLGNGLVVDSTVHDGLWCAFQNWHMGMAAEFISKEFEITRQMQDEFSLASHQKAVKASANGWFADEIAPVEIPQRKGPALVFDTDEAPRADSSLEALSKLKPAFQPDGGTVTAGNAPGITDGAAALVLMGEDAAEKAGANPIARIAGYAQGAVEPKWLFYAPVLAIRNLLQKTGTTLADYDLFEINEAFAAQVLADGKELGLDWSRVNISGGAIALGHPIGASGARVLTTLLYALKRTGGQRGIAALCLGGGEAVALAVEMT